MKKRLFALLLALIAMLGLLAGCSPAGQETAKQSALETGEIRWSGGSSAGAPTDELDAVRAASPAGDAAGTDPEAPVEYDHGTVTSQTAPISGDAAEIRPSGPETPEETADPSSAVDEDGEYTAPEDVADYLRAYGHLPGNFITKREAQALGWPGGDLWKYAPGKSIGGDSFGNYEGLLPEDVRYRECDVNYAGGSRGAERVIYGDDGSVYYTDDHYASFTQLY